MENRQGDAPVLRQTGSFLPETSEGWQEQIGQSRPLMEAVLFKLCHDDRSREKAREIVADVIADCCGATKGVRSGKSLLENYHGRCPLPNWLAGVAVSRLKNWWKSGQYRYEVAGYEEENLTEHNPPSAEDTETVALLADALQAAFHRLEAKRWVILRLIFLHGVQRDRVAAMLRCHPSTITRELASILEQVKKQTLGALRDLDPYLELTWPDFLALCQNHPKIFASV
jgi:RNA polymerase sigma factor (sigma-70 family)